MSLIHGITKSNIVRALRLDHISQCLKTIPYKTAQVHEGNAFFVLYSVADLGAATTPDDMMTLTFTSADTTKWCHFTFTVNGTIGWTTKLIEGGTGGGASPTGSLTVLNKDRNSSMTSGVLDVAVTPVVNKVSYDATLVTGGTTLWEETLGTRAGISTTAGCEELLLKQNTQYQVSLYGTDAAPGIMYLSWFEHTNLV